MVLAARTGGNRFGLFECRNQIVAGKAAYLMQFDMIVFTLGQQVVGKLRGIAPLFGFEDHVSPPGPLPSADIRSSRIAATSRQAACNSASVSGVTGSEPVFTALASWFRFADNRD